MQAQNHDLLRSLADVLLTAPAQGSLPVWDVTSGCFVDSRRASNCGAALSTGIELENATPSTVGVPVQGPYAYGFKGRAWCTDGGVDKTVEAWWQLVPVSGFTVQASMQLKMSINGAAVVTPFTVSQGGIANFVGTVYANTLDITSVVYGLSFIARGDSGGVASATVITNATVAAGSGNSPTMIKVPASAAAAQAGWMKIYVGTTAYVVPYWAAA